MAAIKGKPTEAVAKLTAPTKNNDVMESSWEVPSSMTKSSNKKRATKLHVSWLIGMSNGQQVLTNEYDTSKTSVDINLNNFSIGSTAYTRSSFYPNNNNPKLNSLGIKVVGWNKKGLSENQAVATKTFLAPNVPTIDEIDFATSGQTAGRCSTTITAAESTEDNERYDTKYRVTVTNTRTGTTTVTTDSSSTSSEVYPYYDVTDYQQLNDEQYVHVNIMAYSRGYAGDSAEVNRNIYVSKPAKATITGVSISSKDSTGTLTALIKTNQTTEHPVDIVKLEYLANVTYANASDIPAQNTSWSDSGIEDNGDCTALSMPITNLVPDRGRYTWIRVKTIHLHEGVLYRYSDYMRVEDLETPPAEASESTMKILSVLSGEGGESAVVQLGWNVSGTDDATGTELSWSDEEDTWKSTKDPDNYEFTWSDGSFTSGGVTYQDSAKITIKGLTEGKKYYIKARRYYEGEATSYGLYSNTATVITSEKPAAVVASCSSTVPAGEPLSVYWTFSGSGLQTEWQILAKKSVSQSFTGNGSNKVFTVANEVASVTSVKVNNTATSAYSRSGQTFTFTTAPANNATVLITYDSYSVVVANGSGSIGGTQISAQRLKDLATDNSLTFIVKVSTGSGFVSSDSKTVTIQEKPTLSLTVGATLSAQPFSFTASSAKICDLIVIVTSNGISGQFPDGYKEQAKGDTIYSDVYSPTWSSGSATITLPKGLDFWDNGQYTVSVVAEDRNTKLRSAEVKKTFKVNWTNKAADPDSAITLTALDYTTDDESEHVQGVQIALTPPTGYHSTDVYDIYRMNGDKADLIGKGFPLTHTTVDKYAPFSDSDDLYYRIAIRTADGDVEYADKEYTLASDTIRFDWQGGSLELPYGVSIGDSYKKSVEFRQHMDGSVDGYWNKNIERGSSFSSSIIKLVQPEEISLARQLARYAGPVFVRTKNGSAFVADVQVTDLSVKNKAVTAIAVDATEVDTTDEFMLPSPFSQ